MNVKTLNLTNFRNYITFSSNFSESTNIFVGKNAQGKTSILESLYVLGLTKSHKLNKERDLIRIGTEYAKINALINLNHKDIELDIVVSKAGKKAKYNQIELEKLSDYIGILNVVMFSPEDLDLVKGNPQTRRRFLDLELGQISKEYLYNLQNYRKILKQRNDLLKTLQSKKDNDLLLLDIITDQLVGFMELIVKQRQEFIEIIKKQAERIYKNISNSEDEFLIKYLPNVKKDFKKELSNKYQYDIITGTTNLGIHRDDIDFFINKLPIKTHGSQGEMRTAVLSIKLSLIDFIHQFTNNYPILLLDDVLSELDKYRQNSLFEYIKNKTQTFITSTDINEINIKNINNFKVFIIENGAIKESDKNE